LVGLYHSNSNLIREYSVSANSTLNYGLLDASDYYLRVASQTNTGPYSANVIFQSGKINNAPIFSAGDLFEFAFSDRPDNATGAKLQSDGKIIIVGSSENVIYWNKDFAVARFNSNGYLDPEFDKDGKVTTSFGVGNEYANGVAVQSDGKIIVTGYAVENGKSVFAISRYNNDGSLDISFDGDGKLKRQPTLKNLSRDYDFLPKFGKQVGLRQIILPCMYKNYICFAKLEF
jgi:uncharacterized delta-60 repeat protein